MIWDIYVALWRDVLRGLVLSLYRCKHVLYIYIYVCMCLRN